MKLLFQTTHDLLARTGFGGSPTEIEQLMMNACEASIERLSRTG